MVNFFFEILRGIDIGVPTGRKRVFVFRDTSYRSDLIGDLFLRQMTAKSRLSRLPYFDLNRISLFYYIIYMTEHRRSDFVNIFIRFLTLFRQHSAFPRTHKRSDQFRAAGEGYLCLSR